MFIWTRRGWFLLFALGWQCGRSARQGGEGPVSHHAQATAEAKWGNDKHLFQGTACQGQDFLLATVDRAEGLNGTVPHPSPSVT
jgi:hypothetical protein